MYNFDQVLDGIKYSVFFFSTFTGHFHPFTPHKPIDLEEMYNPQRRAYYLAWYVNEDPSSGTTSAPKLRYLEKFWIRFSDYPPPENKELIQGSYFYAIRREATGI